IPLLWSPSMSLSVNLAMKLCELAGKALADKDADVEILERHHRFKEDSPSGTALKFGEIISRQMGHTGQVHGRSGRASNRDCYAQGALAAAKFLAGKPAGLYGMADVLGL